MDAYPKIYFSTREVIKSDLVDKNNFRSGFTENYFEFVLQKHFKKYIFKNKIIDDNKEYPYYPDFILSIPKYNLFIDIEVDEPYAYNSKKPIHFDDTKRNNYFLSNGWDIIRFSEEQIIKYPILCCKVIAEHIEIITQDRIWLEGFHNVDDIPLQKAWTREEASDLAEKSYRNHYLTSMQEFNLPEPELLIIGDGIFLNREIMVVTSIYQDIYPNKIFSQHTSISGLVKGVLKYCHEYEFNKAPNEKIYIEFIIFISTHHSFNNYEIDNDLIYIDNFVINVYFVRTDKVICFQIDQYVLQKTETKNLFLIADDGSYGPLINDWDKNIRLARKRDDSRMPTEIRYIDVAYPLGIALGLEGYEL